MSMSSISDIIGGLLLAVMAGVMNGSWNVSFSPIHGCAVGRTKQSEKVENGSDSDSGSGNDRDNTERTHSSDSSNSSTSSEPSSNSDRQSPDLSYNCAFPLFQLYAALINIPICIFWSGGPSRVNDILREASTKDITLVCLLSVICGIGIVGFGLACRIAGVGVGTNICMGTVMVLGTFLPLCVEGSIATPAGAVVVSGLALCCAGLVFSAWSLQVRDADERGGLVVIEGDDKRKFMVRRRTMNNITMSLSFRSFRYPTNNTSSFNSIDDIIYDPDDPADPDGDDDDDEELQLEEEPHRLPIDKEKNQDDAAVSPPPLGTRTNEKNTHSTFYKVAVCVIAGCCASQLQFAFIFGKNTIETPVIWLLAISLGVPVSLLYGLYNKPKDIPFSRIWQCPWYRHVLLVLTASVPWVAHIHLYGYSTTLLPEALGAAVSWSILRMATVVTALLWSLGLGEWKYASQNAKTKLFQGLGFALLGIAVIMVSVSL